MGGLDFIIMYHNIDKYFTLSDNYTMPFFMWLCVMDCAGELIMSMCHSTMPCHRLFLVLVREEENSDAHY